jgi:hypothetical protein
MNEFQEEWSSIGASGASQETPGKTITKQIKKKKALLC